MVKLILIFVVGIIETFLYTLHLVAVNRRNALMAGILMTIYIFVYLTIVAYAIKNENTLIVLLVYSCACGIGTFIGTKPVNSKKGIIYQIWQQFKKKRLYS